MPIGIASAAPRIAVRRFPWRAPTQLQRGRAHWRCHL